MNRRAFLVGASATTISALAGCAQQDGTDGTVTSPTNDETRTTAGTTRTDATGSAATQQTVDGVELPVPESELSRGAPKDAIPAITDPAFGADWSDVDASLAATEQVIGVERNGEARAYPLSILNWHEIVNDEFGGPLLVSYCPLCGSGVVAERRVDGEATTFGVSGYLWKSDLVMYDQKTDSLWSQIFATAIRGPKTGSRIELVPFQTTTWDAWTNEHPDTEVLLPPPESESISGPVSRDYDRDPYANYDTSSRIGIGQNELEDERLHPKAEVIGVTSAGEARAYPLERVSDAGVVNDTVGDLPVVVAVGPDETLVAYDRRVDGETLSFETDDARHLTAGGSRWRLLTGEAVDGPYEGTSLTQANDRSAMFWFAWVDFNPETTLYER